MEGDLKTFHGVLYPKSMEFKLKAVLNIHIKKVKQAPQVQIFPQITQEVFSPSPLLTPPC